MKGDGNIKKIVIKIIGTGPLDLYQANVKIFDCNKLIFYGNTYNGELKLCLEKNKAYKIFAKLNNEIIKSTFYVSDQEKYIFYYNHSIYDNSRTITFLLKDFYYKIPIVKGEIILGKNN